MVRPELNHASQLEGNFQAETDPGLIELAMEVQAALSAPSGADLLALDRAHDELQRRLRALSTQLGRMLSLQLFWRTEDAADFTEACSLRSTFAVSRASLEQRHNQSDDQSQLGGAEP
jgi:hypothetical protein